MKTCLSLASLVLLAGCGGAGDATKVPDPVAEVRTAPAQLGASDDRITAYGVTEAGPGTERSISTPAEAIVSVVLAPTGTAVGNGQGVVVLVPTPATRAALIKASSDLQAARAAYARAQRLRADGLVSDADVETARAAAVSARAAATMGIGAGGLTLRAPAGGTVQGLTVRPGDQVAAGTTIATIGGKGEVRARFGIDPSLAARVHPGMPVEVSPATGGASVTVPVVGVDPQVDATTRLASAFVRLPGGRNLSAGETMRATLSIGAASSAISVPYAALLDDGGRSFVFVVKGGVAREREVSPGNSDGDRIQILKGLNPGDRVVTEGGTALEDGMKVRENAAGTAK